MSELTESDVFFLLSAFHTGNRLSIDPGRRCGAILTLQGKLIASAVNGLPTGVADLPERRERPAKYLWTEHAERNAIYAAARRGRSTAGATMHLSWHPCADCARAIVQSGIARLVGVDPAWDDPYWGEGFAVARDILREGGVDVRLASPDWLARHGA